ncbi:uncharacterized protein LOC128962792 [Oppia nitens]|uniref:uncharacterized protein LOC128962792 n=1 Tax=Oppia nitens TaxID=1686743 RepID=UPI0023D9FC79|nr:uncharacterized protein LOC128962792 [Oppia nitens]
MKSLIVLVIQLSVILLLFDLSKQSKLIDNNNNIPDLDNIQAPVPPLPVVVNQPNIPVEWDWRKYGIVTPAKNQGLCGSCWSFVSVAALESHLMKVQIAEGKFDPKKQLSLSEQNLIDCTTNYGNDGCNGGTSRNAFEYVNETKGLNTINDYPYTGKLNTCRYNKEKRVDIDIKDIVRITTGSDQELVSAIYTYGPVTVAIHVTNNFHNYSSGILDDPKCDANNINLSLLAIGYNPEYFILKNSWGTKWGENGFLRLSRSKVNNCGVSQQAYYPVLANDVGTDQIRDKLKENNNKTIMKSSIVIVIQLLLLLSLIDLSYNQDSAPVSSSIPLEWDWRKYGIVTPARNRFNCSATWSFASITALESHVMKAQIVEGKFDPTKQLILSQQNLIDCSNEFGNRGCDGGYTRAAFEYVNETKGLNTINDYPYIGKSDICHFKYKKRVNISIKEIKRITTGADDELVSAIYTYGPVTVGFHQTDNFVNYSSGIFEDYTCDANKINVALVAVGYTPEYFILKNNFGTNWGENGYVRLSRSKYNNCGVSEQAYYPVLVNDMGTDKIRDKLKEVSLN